MATEQENNANLPQEHPLLNPLVLKQVFEYLKPNASFYTLQDIRQVCQVWKDETLGWWRQTAVLHLTRDMLEEPELTTINQLLENKPFHKYKLKDGATIDLAPCFEEGTHANRFWNTVGPYVKHLILEWVEFRSTGLQSTIQNPEQAIMKFLIDLVPNLTNLDIRHIYLVGVFWVSTEDSTISARHRQDKRILEFKHPNLVSLKLDWLSTFAFSNFPNLQHVALESCDALLNMLRNEVSSSEDDQIIAYKNSCIKHLDLILPENTSDPNVLRTNLDLLSRMKFSCLERLSLDFRDEQHNLSFRVLPIFLKDHYEHLKILEVSCFPYVRPYSTFPFDCQLDQLTELRLWGNVVKDLSFLKWTPKLKVLHMDPYGLEIQHITEPNAWENMHVVKHDIVEAAVNDGLMEGVVLDNLEYLQINYGLLSLESLKRLGEWMPNVKTLKTVLGKGSVGVIFEQWPLLENLVGMHGSILTDEDIIGTGQQGGLPCLWELMSFQLNAACNEGRLTDVAVHFGFLKMGKLTDLQICVSDQFTLQTEKLLKDRLWNVVIIRNYTGNDEHKNWKCCQNSKHLELLHDSRFVRNLDHWMNWTTSDNESDDEI